jgi:hypothetical protein
LQRVAVKEPASRLILLRNNSLHLTKHNILNLLIAQSESPQLPATQDGAVDVLDLQKPPTESPQLECAKLCVAKRGSRDKMLALGHSMPCKRSPCKNEIQVTFLCTIKEMIQVALPLMPNTVPLAKFKYQFYAKR